jgi:hypothetical protein
MSKPTDGSSRRNPQVTAAWIAGLFAILAAVVTVVLTSVLSGDGGQSQAGPSSTLTLSATPTPQPSTGPRPEGPEINAQQFSDASDIVVTTDGVGFEPESAVRLIFFVDDTEITFPIGGAVRVGADGRFHNSTALPRGVNYCSTSGAVAAFIDNGAQSVAEDHLTFTC